MATRIRETLVVALPAAETEQALDDVLGERGFERVEAAPPSAPGAVSRSEARFFDVDGLGPSLSLIREWAGYSDATSWGSALELAEGLPAASRMEMALPPALSVLGRALSRRATVVGVAVRERPWHLVAVAFRDGRAVDVFTAVKVRLVVGADGLPQTSTLEETRTKWSEWAGRYGATLPIEIILGERDLVSGWRFRYLHRDQ